MSELWWKKLPNRLRDIMAEEGKKLDDEMFAFAQKQRKMFQNIWKKNGGELIHFSPAEQNKLMSTLASVGATVVARNPELKATYDRLLAAVKKTRK